MTRKRVKVDESEAPSVDPNVQLLHDLIETTFVNNAAVIAKHHKPETLLKMIQACDELKPNDRSNEKLWKLVERARRELLGKAKTSRRKTSGKRQKKGPS